MDPIRYSAAACQTDLPNPTERRQMSASTDRMLWMIDQALAGAAPFLPVRLVVFPEFAHAAPVFVTAAELHQKLAVELPNEHTDRVAPKAREHGIYVQMGLLLERDARRPAPDPASYRASSPRHPPPRALVDPPLPRRTPFGFTSFLF